MDELFSFNDYPASGVAPRRHAARLDCILGRMARPVRTLGNIAREIPYHRRASGITTPLNSDQSGDAAFKPLATPKSMASRLFGL